MNKPEISVVIPLYNKERFIERALQSVFAQTIRDFEVIVIDDGSTDRGLEGVARFSDARLRVIRQANGGPGAARNRGARESSSEFVAFLDADDELLPEFLEQNLSNLKANPRCTMSLCAFLEGPERRICSGINGSMKPGIWRMPPGIDGIMLKQLCSSVHAYGLIRKPAFFELEGYYENRCLLGEDTYLLLKVLLNHQIYLEPEPLIWYHSEDAELCFHYVHNRAGKRHRFRKTQPVVPALTDPQGLRRKCPADYRGLLERYLAYEALSEAQTRVSVGDPSVALELRRRFPLISSFGYNYRKLQLKLALPALSRSVAWIKSLRSDQQAHRA